MKTSLFAFIFLVPLSIVAQGDGATSMLRRAQGDDNGNGNGNGRRKSKQACVTILSEKQFLDHTHVEEQPVECELQGEDLDGKGYRMVQVKGLPPGWAKQNGIKSGVSTIEAQGFDIDDYTNELIVPSGAEVVIGNSGNNGGGNGNGGSNGNGRNRGRNLANVVKKVLVLRVVASDAETTATETELADAIFGASGDAFNLQSQYKACSYDQLQFNAVTSNTDVGLDGVYTVNLPTTVVNGAADSVIREAARDEATLRLGTLTDIADHVMVCLPPGTTGGWIAYAYVKSWLSVFNDIWCGYPSGQIHEIGHNLNLAHAGEGTSAYHNQSGLMGYSYRSDDSPKMCFNGPKSWQLGWYSDYHVDLSTNNYNWSGDLVGFAEKVPVSDPEKMIIRIQDDNSNTDTYVHFNRQIGFNSETKEGGNQVLVSTRTSGVGYAASNLKAKLNADGVYYINDIGGSGASVRITVKSINTFTTPARANISVQLVLQPTPAPVAHPTAAPVAPLTASPVVPPTIAPVAPPTTAPVVPLTIAPVVPPTEAPIVPPTDAPVVAPTAAPVVAPTASPVVPTSCDDNGICELGEDCNSCPGDCNAKHGCCVGGDCASKMCNQGKSWKCVL